MKGCLSFCLCQSLSDLRYLTCRYLHGWLFRRECATMFVCRWRTDLKLGCSDLFLEGGDPVFVMIHQWVHLSENQNVKNPGPPWCYILSPALKMQWLHQHTLKKSAQTTSGQMAEFITPGSRHFDIFMAKGRKNVTSAFPTTSNRTVRSVSDLLRQQTFCPSMCLCFSVVFLQPKTSAFSPLFV